MLEGSEGELGSHPQPPGWTNVRHNLDLGGGDVSLYYRCDDDYRYDDDYHVMMIIVVMIIKVSNLTQPPVF